MDFSWRSSGLPCVIPKDSEADYTGERQEKILIILSNSLLSCQFIKPKSKNFLDRIYRIYWIYRIWAFTCSSCLIFANYPFTISASSSTLPYFLYMSLRCPISTTKTRRKSSCTSYIMSLRVFPSDFTYSIFKQDCFLRSGLG